jgi:STE24 endopeptidase
VTALLTGYLLVLAFSLWLRGLNNRHLRIHGREVPPELRDVVDPETLGRISVYTLDGSRLDLVRTLIHSLLVLGFLFAGGLGLYDRWIASWTGSFIGSGILFFLVLSWAETLLGIPFSLYRNFRIEARHGFNTMTGRVWSTDLLKSILLSSVLMVVASSAALALVQWSPERWWLWVWGFFLLFSVLLLYIAPYVIEPLFFKMEPVRDEELAAEVRSLLQPTGLEVRKILQVDASRRSRHSNAYFTGIGRVKRIVLFDTLLEQMSRREILAVLAHEVGHWKLRHILKRLVFTEAVALGASYLAYRLVAWNGLPRLVGLEDASFPARLVLLGFLGSLALFPLTPLFSALSRRAERQADRFGSELTGRPADLAAALAKLSRENLSNLHPHPWYAWFHHSHPPVAERLRALRLDIREK